MPSWTLPSTRPLYNFRQRPQRLWPEGLLDLPTCILEILLLPVNKSKDGRCCPWFASLKEQSTVRGRASREVTRKKACTPTVRNTTKHQFISQLFFCFALFFCASCFDHKLRKVGGCLDIKIQLPLQGYYQEFPLWGCCQKQSRIFLDLICANLRESHSI